MESQIVKYKRKKKAKKKNCTVKVKFPENQEKHCYSLDNLKYFIKKQAEIMKSINKL